MKKIISKILLFGSLISLIISGVVYFYIKDELLASWIAVLGAYMLAIHNLNQK